MKSVTRLASAFASLLSTASMAQAHPGHIPNGGFSASHDGNAALVTIAIVAASWISCHFAAQKRE